MAYGKKRPPNKETQMAVQTRRRFSSSAPVRWDPFRDLEELQARTAQLIGSALPAALVQDDGPWVPPVDIEETDDAWILEAEVPGVQRGDINVDFRDNELVITGEIKERERKGILRRRTRRVGEFEFRVTLPGDIDRERVDADLHDGVLTVRIPKPAESEPRRIEINTD
jgi:HSP20 family protein